MPTLHILSRVNTAYPCGARLLPSVLLTAVCLAASPRPTQAEDTGSGPDPALVATVDKALSPRDIASGFVGVEVRSLKDGALLYSRNSGHVFLPASNNKLLTSTAALEYLGVDFVYKTRLVRTGPLRPDGSIDGDVILRGAGDPILLADDLRTMAKQAYAVGLRHVAAVQFDDSLFDDQRLGDWWSWDDEPFYYSAEISALNVDENLVLVKASPGAAAGDPVTVSVTATDRYALLENTATTGAAGTKSTLNISRMEGRNLLTVEGSLPVDIRAADNHGVAVTIHDPSRFAATLLTEYLRAAGVTVDNDPIGGAVTPPGAVTIAEHDSPPLSGVLKRLNKPSDNLIAECLMKTVGAAVSGQGTGGAGGTGEQAARRLFRRIGMDLSQLRQVDGSGLSRGDYVSPANLVKLLTYLHTRKDFPALYDSLPIAGVDGSLRNRMKGTAAAGNCHAKTGSLSHVTALSGYVNDRDGEPLVLSILMNNVSAPASQTHAAEDAIVEYLASYSRQPR